MSSDVIFQYLWRVTVILGSSMQYKFRFCYLFGCSRHSPLRMGQHLTHQIVLIQKLTIGSIACQISAAKLWSKPRTTIHDGDVPPDGESLHQNRTGKQLLNTKKLSRFAYHELQDYNIQSKYNLTAISQHAEGNSKGIGRNVGICGAVVASDGATGMSSPQWISLTRGWQGWPILKVTQVKRRGNLDPVILKVYVSKLSEVCWQWKAWHQPKR